MNKQLFTCHIQFKGRDSHEKKTFKSKLDAVDFIERNRDKIHYVNTWPLLGYKLFDLVEIHAVSREELNYILDNDPFE